MRRLFWILAGVLAAVAVPASLAVTIGTPPATTQSIVNNGAGDQTDPHVSGSLVSYTSCTAWACRIHYHDLATGTDAVIPTTVSPISGATWIWAPGITGATTPAELAQYFFSKSITLAAAPTAASFLVAVDDFAELRINGTVVGTRGARPTNRSRSLRRAR